MSYIRKMTPLQIELDHLRALVMARAVIEHGGHQGRAAKALGIGRNTIGRALARDGISMRALRRKARAKGTS